MPSSRSHVFLRGKNVERARILDLQYGIACSGEIILRYCLCTHKHLYSMWLTVYRKYLLSYIYIPNVYRTCVPLNSTLPATSGVLSKIVYHSTRLPYIRTTRPTSSSDRSAPAVSSNRVRQWPSSIRKRPSTPAVDVNSSWKCVLSSFELFAKYLTSCLYTYTILSHPIVNEQKLYIINTYFKQSMIKNHFMPMHEPLRLALIALIDSTKDRIGPTGYRENFRWAGDCKCCYIPLAPSSVDAYAYKNKIYIQRKSILFLLSIFCVLKMEQHIFYEHCNVAYF